MKKDVYVPYKYKCKGQRIIDPITGCLTISNPRIKGDGSRARIK